MKKVLFISEYLNPPYDEGIKKTVYNLYKELNENFELKVITRYGFPSKNVISVRTNKLFLSRTIQKEISTFRPDTIIYLPFQSSTFASYLRLKVLSLLGGKASLLFIALQPKPLKKWQRLLLPLLRPSFAFTPSLTLSEFWNSKGIPNHLIPLLTDLNEFKPAIGGDDKNLLREKYQLPKNKFIISHMGHLNKGRNLTSLIPLQNDEIQVVVVGSSSTPEDAKEKSSLRNELISAGIIIVERYIEKIQEIYQLSDLYIFPVNEENSSIGMPLSILEARACGTPVLTTDYGSIKAYLGNDRGGIFYSSSEKFNETLTDIKSVLDSNFTKTEVQNLNQEFYSTIFSKI
ncbi:MAG: glycosyltransferase family 4 protein [Flavobacteriaceae bacterium]